jgi:hypothetical protein
VNEFVDLSLVVARYLHIRFFQNTVKPFPTSQKDAKP